MCEWWGSRLSNPLRTVCLVQFCTLDFNIQFPLRKSVLVFKKFQTVGLSGTVSPKAFSENHEVVITVDT